MKSKRGFTLIEVISVLVILGLLATIVVTQYSAIVSEGRKRLNEEQKSRLVEVAKNVSLNNKTCLEIAKNNSANGVKITLEQMKKNGYIANNEIKDLQNNTLINSCIIIKWNDNYGKFEYEYSESCDSAQSCIVTAESEKVIVSSFYVGEGNTHYTSSTNVTYYIRYSTSISAEYCVTLENEASCSWKKLDMNSTSASGLITLTAVENIVHLYIRNSSKNVIASIDDTITLDHEAPVCTWKVPNKSYIKNGSTTDIVLNCNDAAGIRNVELLSTDIVASNPGIISLSDAVVTSNGTNKEFKFTVFGLEGNGSTTLSLKSGVISDTSGNITLGSYTSGNIYVDNIVPTGQVSVNEDGNQYTNSERVTLRFSGVSSDVERMCVSNSSEGNCEYVNYAPTYAWTLSPGEGAKTMYVSLVDRAGNVLNKTATIYLDTIAPNCIATTTADNYNIKNGSYVDYIVNCTDNNTISNTETIDLSELLIDKQGTSDVRVSIEESNKTIVKVRVQALSGNGKSIVTLKEGAIRDSAGNYSRLTEVARVNVDNIAPGNNSIVTNHNASITHLQDVPIQLYSDVRTEGGYYCLTSTNSADSCSSWNNYVPLTSFKVGNNNGNYTIYAFFKDYAGNISTSAASGTIKYDRDAISCILTLNQDHILINPSVPSRLATLPYSQDLINWNSNAMIPKVAGQIGYFSYVKDINGETNYCEVNLPE